MDQRFTGFSDYIDDLRFDDEFVLPSSDHHPYTTTNGSKFENPSLNLDYTEPPMAVEVPPHVNPNTSISSISWSPEADPFAISSSLSPEVGSADSPPLSDDSDSDPILRFIRELLMEESGDDGLYTPHDSSALQATEMSLNEVLGQHGPPLTYQPSLDANHNTLTLDDIFSGSSSADNGSGAPTTTSSTSTSNSTDHKLLGHLEDHHSSPLRTHPSNGQIFQSSSQAPVDLQNSSVGYSINEFLVQNILSGNESVLHFQRGLEEARKFLPGGNQSIIDPESNTFSSTSRGRKNHEREDIDLAEGRSNKQPAVYTDESELSEMFDKVLLGTKGNNPPCCDEVALQIKANRNLHPTGLPQGSKNGKGRVKKQGKKAEAVDLRSLLMLCAQAVSSYDRRTANELLKQIREHSSPSGDGTQRLAHYFADGLEARLAGTGTAAQSFHNCLASKRTSVVDVLKAYHLYLSTCPFKKFAIFFANRKILDLAAKATTIHIVDFGIGYGFQWPSFIQHLAYETAKPPKLRITGVDLPQPGFRPAEGIELAGHRLKSYCERFKVPFEYNAIASQNWETIQLEELNLDKSDTLVVNCLFRSQNLFDETVEQNSPRDTVLNLIKEMNPDVFIHSIVTGSYNAPFFITRFREALFHHSALFDMFDTTISREDQGRLLFERELFGREAMNVIACEGPERIERPETYKQWQGRTLSAGFRPVPLDQEFMKKLRAKLKLYGYHKDFVVDEGGNWLLQGWKGRIIFASSAWTPAQH